MIMSQYFVKLSSTRPTRAFHLPGWLLLLHRLHIAFYSTHLRRMKWLGGWYMVHECADKMSMGDKIGLSWDRESYSPLWLTQFHLEYHNDNDDVNDVVDDDGDGVQNKSQQTNSQWIKSQVVSFIYLVRKTSIKCKPIAFVFNFVKIH